MKINGKEIPKELLSKAIACETPEELVKAAKESGFELTTEQADKFLTKLDAVDLTPEQLRQVAGGTDWEGEIDAILQGM